MLPVYLTAWSLAFGIWGFVDGAAMFDSFSIPAHSTTMHDQFILQNSAARYLGIAAALVVGIFVFRTRGSIVTALAARGVMDILDLVAGLRTGLLEAPVWGVFQSFAMFLLPNLLAIALLRIAARNG